MPLEHLAYAPPLEADETLWSWVTRVALYHGWSADEFLRLLGFGERSWEDYFRQRDIDCGAPAELIDALAEVSGFPRESVALHRLKHSPSTLWLDDRVAFCETCWSSDAVPYIRRAWLDAWCIDCPIHGCPLVSIAEVQRPRHAADWNAAWACRPDWAEQTHAVCTSGTAGYFGRAEIVIVRPPGAFERASLSLSPPGKQPCSTAETSAGDDGASALQLFEKRLVLLAGTRWGDFSLVRAFFDLRDGLAWRNVEHGHDPEQPVLEPLGSLALRSAAIRMGRSLLDILFEQPYREPRIADPLRCWMGGVFNSPRRFLMQELAKWPPLIKERWKRQFEWGDEFEWLRCARMQTGCPRARQSVRKGTGIRG